MKVLVACEESQTVCLAFRRKGHEAYSCDVEPTLGAVPGWHYQCDVREVLEEGWDLIIAHPPCTFLTVSGNKHYADKPELYKPAALFAMMFFDYADKVCVENPVGRLSTLWRKPDQYIQPWQFGHGETKKTGLWLKGLPLLQPTNIVEGREQRVWKMGPSKERSKLRSKTYDGIALAMAEQWG